MSNKKVTIASIVLNNFKNDSRVLKEAKSLQNNGYSVIVVALHENSLDEHEKVENFNVHRIKLTSRSWSKNKAVQLLKYFEFIFRAVKKYRNYNIIHCHDLNTLPIGVIVKLLFNRKTKVVYDAHEYETEIDGPTELMRNLMRFLEKHLIKHADAVITVSDSIANEYVRLYQIEKPSLVLNTPPLTKVVKENIFRNSFNIREDQTIFLYQGILHTRRGIELLLEAFSNMKSDKNVIVFMGFGPYEGLIQEYAQKSNNIFFQLGVKHNVLISYTASADFGISFIEDCCLSYHYCLPNKIFEYVMAGLPVLTSNLPEMKKLIDTYKIGVVANDNTVDDFLQAVQKLSALNYNELSDNAKNIRGLFSWEVQEKQLLNIYKTFN